jgi:hypothetical protein
VLRLTASGPTRNLRAGERCWIGPDDLRWLLREKAVRLIGEPPPGIVVPPDAPPANALGDLQIKFHENFTAVLPNGRLRFWAQDEVDWVPERLARSAIIENCASYTDQMQELAS